MKYTKFPGRFMFGALNVMSDFLCSSIECEAKNFLLALAPSATTHITYANIRRCQCIIIQYILATVLHTFNSASESNLIAFHMMYTRSSADTPMCKL